MRSRILSVVLISVFLVLYYTKDSKACFSSPTEYEEYRFGLFVPYSQQLRNYDGMYFSYFFMHDIDNEKGVETDRQINVNEWYEYLHHGAKKLDIYELLYKTSPAAFSEALTLRNDTSRVSLHRNSFYQYLLKSEHKKVFDYICHAKEYETRTGGKLDPWDDDFFIKSEKTTAPYVFDDYDSLGNDNFLKARYHYLSIRQDFTPLAFDDSSHFIVSIEDDYTELMKLPINTIVKGWAAYFYAFSQKGAKGNFLLAQAFNQSNDKKSPIYRQFSVDLLDQSIKYAKTNRELANLYCMAALKRHGKGVELIDKVYKLDPANPNLSFLMVREISKLEDRILTPKYTDMPSQAAVSFYEGSKNYSRPISEEMHLSEWKDFLTKCLSDSFPKDKFFFNLCMAHTCLIDGKAADAIGYLAEAKKYPASDNELLYQFKLTELAATINDAKLIDANMEVQILPTLQWLEKNKDHFENSPLVMKQVHLWLAKKYESEGNIARSIMARSKYNWFAQFPVVPQAYYFDIDSSIYLYMQEAATGADVEAFVKTMQKGNKSAFEKYYIGDVKQGSYIWNMACEAAGSNYLREAEYSAALRMFSLIPDSYWKTGHKGEVMKDCLSTDPFTAHTGDNHAHSPVIKDSTQRYNKRTFVAHLVKLLKQDGNKPDSLLKIADALYNMGYFGNSWILTRNSWSAFDGVFNRSEWGAGNKYSPKYYEYYACRRARAWYQQAYYSSNNREVKAKALLMMAQCDKNYAYMLSPKRKYQSTALFDQFARSYADTRYYQDLTSECDIQEVKGYFYQFIP
jgi:hypothetical protein